MDLAPFRRTYGRFPVERRDWPVSAEEFARFAARGREPVGAAALIWNDRREILLVRERSAEGKEAAWATPGGFAEKGETPEACVHREALEEAGANVRIAGLTKVVICYVSSGDRVLPFTFFQFEAQHLAGTARAGREIAEAAWFDRLPDDLHFRADYVEVWRRGRPSL